MSKKWRLSLIGTAVLFFLVINPSKAQANETFSIDNKALNTNWNFRRIDGNPRMSIYQRRDSDPDQQFTRMQGNRGGIILRHGSTGRCLNAHYLSNGAEINVWNCDGNDPDQNWNLIDVGQGRILIQRSGTNLCIDTPTRNNEAKVHLWTCDRNNPNQRWQSSRGIVEPPPPPLPPSPGNPGGSALLTQQGPQYFRDRLQFYGRDGNIFTKSGFGSNLVDGVNRTDGNCTWYAHGRIKELGGNVNALNSMNGNANQWHNQLSNGAIIVDRNNVRAGDIAQWTTGRLGHVAVVERVYTVNGVKRIVISESHYDTNYDGGRPGTLHRIMDYLATNPTRFIRVPGAAISSLPSAGIIVNQATGRALDAGGANNTQIYPHPSPNPSNPWHMWRLQQAGDHYLLINQATGRALDAGGANNTQVYPHPSPNPSNPWHLWKIDRVGSSYILINKATGRALDAGGNNGNLIYPHPNPNPSNHFHLWKIN